MTAEFSAGAFRYDGFSALWGGGLKDHVNRAPDAAVAGGQLGCRNLKFFGGSLTNRPGIHIKGSSTTALFSV